MAHQRKARVLVADAEAVARFGLVHLLNSHPQLLICGEAESLGAARDLAAKLRPELLVFDPTMGDGTVFLKELARWSPTTRTVAHTNRCDALSVQRALQLGVCGYVNRRDPVAALMAAVLGAIRGERQIGPLVERTLLDGLARGSMDVRQQDESCLSERELAVYRLVGRGLPTRAVAQELRVSVKTVETHRQHIREKLHLPNSRELQRRAVLYHGLHVEAA
jgi:DNA-binding NarL/FixJ family response regulator